MSDNPKQGRLVQLQPSCCFTSGVVTLNGERKAVKCEAHQKGHDQLLVVCPFCPTHHDSTNTPSHNSAYRCVSCYRAFQIAIKQRMKEFSSPMKMDWFDDLPRSLKALLRIEWTALIETAADDQPSVSVYGQHFDLIDRSDNHVLSSEGGGHSRRFLLRWKEPCPSCYDWDFPSVPPVPNVCR